MGSPPRCTCCFMWPPLLKKIMGRKQKTLNGEPREDEGYVRGQRPWPQLRVDQEGHSSPGKGGVVPSWGHGKGMYSALEVRVCGLLQILWIIGVFKKMCGIYFIVWNFESLFNYLKGKYTVLLIFCFLTIWLFESYTNVDIYNTNNLWTIYLKHFKFFRYRTQKIC